MTIANTPAPKPGTGSRLDFHGPMSAERAARLVAALAARKPATVVDYGSGWGELLLRILAEVPGAHGTGIDIHGPDIVRGRALAVETRKKLDEHLSIWLRGLHNVFGYAFLTLGVPE